MIKKFAALFRDQKQYHLFLLMTLSSLFNVALVAYRLHYIEYDFGHMNSAKTVYWSRGIPTFLFLIWNLFLAWVPYWIALSLHRLNRHTQSKLLLGGLVFTWLLFFPNAPYILTDLLHLRWRTPIPHWYDLMLIVSFAWTGLMLGYLSLFEIQLFLKQKLSPRASWLLSISALLLASYGVYLGRYLRWNSWDIISNPLGLCQDLFETLSNPMAYASTLGIVLVFFVFMLLGYLTLATLIGNKTN
ncbi:MAG: DUF1361 domain-containing protein [Saprospiraceae bacterium]